jgi:hypothetical protein
LLLGLASCGDGAGDPDDALPASEATAAEQPTGTAGAEPEGPDDEAELTRITKELTADQRPGERARIGAITLFDNPDGCDSGEGAVVEVRFPSAPTDGIAVFCRTDAGWQVTQGILYGE